MGATLSSCATHHTSPPTYLSTIFQLQYDPEPLSRSSICPIQLFRLSMHITSCGGAGKARAAVVRTGHSLIKTKIRGCCRKLLVAWRVEAIVWLDAIEPCDTCRSQGQVSSKAQIEYFDNLVIYLFWDALLALHRLRIYTIYLHII